MGHLTKHFKGHYKDLILGPLFKLAEAVLELMVPVIMARIIDVGIANKDNGFIIMNGLLLLLLAVLGMGMATVCQYYAARTAGAFGSGLRKEMFGHILTLSGKETGEIGTGALITRLTNDINQVQTAINMVIRVGTRAPFMAIGSIVMAILIDVKIGLVFLVSTPLIVLVLFVIMKKTLPSYKSIQEEQDRLSRLSAENFEGARVIRAFARQEQEQRDYEDSANRLTSMIIKAGNISATLNPLTTIIINLAIAVIVLMGAGAVNNGRLENGQIIALVSYMNQTLLALIVAANLIVLFTRGIASARRVEAVLKMESAISVDPKAACDVRTGSKVEFENVSFTYHAGASPALEDISFKVTRGHNVGMIGGTGSGKTTIIQLIMRFFDPEAGAVRVNGQNIRGLDPRALRKEIALVPQRAVLFRGTIRDNLLMSDPKATEEDIRAALETAQALEFVEALPKGLDSPVEEGGHNFSGGQRQRLTIARALLRKAGLLILDDSASALDLATDAALRRALQEEMEKNPELTVLMIAQRVSTIKGADQIIVLDDGEISGIGTHEELLRENTIYQEICQSQGVAEAEEEVRSL